MRRLVYLDSAYEDLATIQNYLARSGASVAVAETFVEQLSDQCAKLAAASGTLGRSRPELGEGLRFTPFRGYLIFFRYRPEALEIVNILEGHRDVESYFTQD